MYWIVRTIHTTVRSVILKTTVVCVNIPLLGDSVKVYCKKDIHYLSQHIFKIKLTVVETVFFATEVKYPTNNFNSCFDEKKVQNSIFSSQIW